MTDIKAIYDYERKPVVPRVKPLVPQLVRQGKLEAVFEGIDMKAQPMFGGPEAEAESVALAKAVLAEMIGTMKQMYGDSE